jgi:hypothetical protein
MKRTVLSYGGGLDSWVILLLVLYGVFEKPDLVVFADVADGSPDRDPEDPGEWPGTYRHIREVAMPLCEELGIEFVWLTSDVEPVRPTRENPAGHRSLFAYFRELRCMPGARSKMCTVAAKVDRIGRYLEARFPTGDLEVWIGFGADETTRLRDNRYAQRGRRAERYPLREVGFCRCREERLARSSGYPVPRKSACVFCPHSSRGDFQTLRDELPETFAAVEALEDGCKRTKAGVEIRFGRTKRLRDWVAPAFVGRRERETCPVCGDLKATKRTACSFLIEGKKKREM